MFSGIVEETADVISITPTELGGMQLSVSSRLDHTDTKLGDSICIDGVCLTVINISKNSSSWHLSFDLASETVRKTTLGELKSGSGVHLERSLKIGDRLHGHFVTGHVDTYANLLKTTKEGQTLRFEFEVPENIDCSMLAQKGSVALSGVSLTLGEIKDRIFTVYIIPHTDSLTKLAQLKIGDKVNIEFDILARYIINSVRK